ncbi:MAG: extracellular solute-binding protein [Clostridia bacterium]|nr:extracellular solute-binding protein [Clostridia bacterium]
MKKTTIKLLCLVLAVVAVISLAACKKKPVQTGVVTPPPDGEDIEIKGSIKFSYSGGTSEDNRNAANAFIDAFRKKYPDVVVNRDYSNSDPSTRISSGDIGDVFYFAEVSAYNYAVTQNALMPLEYWMEVLNIDRGDVFSGIFDAGMINNHLYYIARDFNQILFIYNRDALDERGIDQSRVHPDWTWEEFLALCAEITNDDYYGATMQLNYDPVFIPFLEAYNGRGKWFSLKDKSVDLTSGDTLRALNEVLDACREGYINLGLGGDFGRKESVFNFLVYPSINSSAQTYDQKSVDWDLINLPLFKNPAFGAGSSGVGVYNRTSNPGAAAAFALFFYTQEGQRAFNGQTGGSVPLLASLKDDDFWKHPNDAWADKNWDACVYKSEDYATIGRFACLLPPEIADLLNNNISGVLTKALNGGASLEDGMGQLQEKVNQKWSTLANG